MRMRKLPSFKKRVILLAKCLISLGFFAMLFFSVDLEDVKKSFRSIDPLYAGAGVSLSFVMVAASTWKWWVLLKVQGRPLPFWSLYRWYFVGYFYSNFLPSNVGGDVARSWLAGKRAGSHSTVLISIFVERFTGLLFLLFLAVALPLLKLDLWRMPAVWIGSVVGLSGLSLLLLLMAFGVRAGKMKWVKGLLNLGKGILRADRPGKPAGLWDSVAAKLTVLSEKLGRLWKVLYENPAVLFQVFLLTALYYALAILNVCLAFRAFGAWPDLAGIAAVLPVALMVAMIPISLGGLGITEGAYVFYFGLVGLDGGLTLAMGIFLRMKILLLGLVGLVIHLKEPVEAES